VSNEEILARALADELQPWLERIKALEVANIERGAEIRLLKELVLGNRDQKHASGEAWNDPPWPANPGFKSRGLKSAGH